MKRERLVLVGDHFLFFTFFFSFLLTLFSILQMESGLTNNELIVWTLIVKIITILPLFIMSKREKAKKRKKKMFPTCLVYVSIIMINDYCFGLNSIIIFY